MGLIAQEGLPYNSKSIIVSIKWQGSLGVEEYGGYLKRGLKTTGITNKSNQIENRCAVFN
jgi:hypothetical protein